MSRLERSEAIPDASRIEGPGLRLAPRRFGGLFQLQLWHGVPAPAALRLADEAGGVREYEGIVTMATGPGRWLIECAVPGWPEPLVALAPDIGSVADLSHARASIDLSGKDAVALAQKLAPVDLDRRRQAGPSAFQTGSGHGIAFTLRRVAATEFVFYVERSYARDFWHRLAHETAEFGAAEGAD